MLNLPKVLLKKEVGDKEEVPQDRALGHACTNRGMEGLSGLELNELDVGYFCEMVSFCDGGVEGRVCFKEGWKKIVVIVVREP